MVFEYLSGMLGVSNIALYVLLALVGYIGYHTYQKIKTKEQKKRFMTYSAIIIGVIIMFGINIKTNPEWQSDYVTQATTELSNYEQFVESTDYYDYNSAIISSAAEKIASSSSNSKEAMALAAKYVYDNVEYVYGEADNNCYDGTASKILNSGKGQCDTQSIVLIAILRKLGIAAQPVGGCITQNPSCRLQSVFLQSFKEAEGFPKFTQINDSTLEKDVFSRGEFSRLGGLHAYVTAWDSEDGWLYIEPTSGKMADLKCWDYHVEMFPSDNNKEDICVSKNYDYAVACRYDDFDAMDKNGLGLASEVTIK